MRGRGSTGATRRNDPGIPSAACIAVDYLLAIAIFVNGAKGHSPPPPQWSRDLDCQYKTSFVMAQKIREVLASEA
jgi:hypothetical protein